MYNVIEEIAKEERWTEFMGDVQNHLTPYLHSSTPAEDCAKHVNDAGFTIQHCEVEDLSWTFPTSSDFKGWYLSV